jgi:taurine dioxygenase
MADIRIRDVRDDLSFGARVSGVTRAALKDAEVRRELNELFERRGLIVFDGMEPSSHVQVELSEVFGPMRDHPTKNTPRAEDTPPGVIEIHYYPESEDADLVEIDGKNVARWSHWHFDSCYSNELNRAGVLRALVIPPDGGLTGFVDGIQLYRGLPEPLRQKIEQLRVLYILDFRFSSIRFGLPKGFRFLFDTPAAIRIYEESKDWPRALHPAVWTRETGEKVLHISPWMACGLEGRENAEGDALLEAVCQEMLAHAEIYHHSWKPDHMLIWDNWRMVHDVSGMDPSYERRIHRTTIAGDYGLGEFEHGGKVGAVSA